jgi:hypothetical protein
MEEFQRILDEERTRSLAFTKTKGVFDDEVDSEE